MLKVRRVRKQFKKIVAVDDVSFRLFEGETLALLGPNGSGKSTILRCVAGLVRPTSGEIEVNGRDPQSAEARRSFSYLPQRVVFPENLTAREILDFYRRLRNLPRGQDTILLEETNIPDRIIGELSGGMRQRLGLAVALLPDAPLLMLDEPTASLDPRGAIELRRLLLEQKRRGKTIVFSSHVLDDVEALADRVAILVEGRLVALEDVDALRGRLARRVSLEEVYLKYVQEMHSGDRAVVADDCVPDDVAAAGCDR